MAPEKTENNDSVVYIQTNKMQGSGIVLSADGLIATNYHVIKGAATAQFVFADGTIYQGTTTVVGLDTSADIALLRIEKTDLSAATPAFSYKVGDAVTSIGSPGGARNTVSTGTINGYDTDVISTSAVIAPGSSGGALFNSTGEGHRHDLLLWGLALFLYPHRTGIAGAAEAFSAAQRNAGATPIPPHRGNLRARLAWDGYAYVSWAPVYGADHYLYASRVLTRMVYTRISNNSSEKMVLGISTVLRHLYQRYLLSACDHSD